MILTSSIVVRRPLDDVWTFLTSLHNVPKWDRSIARAVQTTSGPMDVGAVVETTSPSGKRQSFRVTVFDRPRRLAFRLLRSPLFRSAELIFTLEGTDGGTRVTHQIDMRARLVFAWLFAVFGMVGRGALATDLDYLRRSLEDGVDLTSARP